MISHFLHPFVSFHLFCVVGIRRERIKIILKYCWCHSVCNAAYLISLSDICHYYARKLLQVMQSRVRWGERDSISGEKRVSDKEKPAKTNPSPSTVRNWEFVSSQISKCECERILGGFFFILIAIRSAHPSRFSPMCCCYCFFRRPIHIGMTKLRTHRRIRGEFFFSVRLVSVDEKWRRRRKKLFNLFSFSLVPTLSNAGRIRLLSRRETRRKAREAKHSKWNTKWQ